MEKLRAFISFFFSSRRRHTRWPRDWSSDVCSSDLLGEQASCKLYQGPYALREDHKVEIEPTRCVLSQATVKMPNGSAGFAPVTKGDAPDPANESSHVLVVCALPGLLALGCYLRPGITIASPHDKDVHAGENVELEARILLRSCNPQGSIESLLHLGLRCSRDDARYRQRLIDHSL